MHIHIIHEKQQQERYKMQALSTRSIQTQVHPETKMMFWFLFASSRGAATRTKIVKQLQEIPFNTHQLAKEMSMDYKAVKHHLDILEKNNLVGKFEAVYGAAYFLSPLFEENQSLFEEIKAKIKV